MGEFRGGSEGDQTINIDDGEDEGDPQARRRRRRDKMKAEAREEAY